MLKIEIQNHHSLSEFGGPKARGSLGGLGGGHGGLGSGATYHRISTPTPAPPLAPHPSLLQPQEPEARDGPALPARRRARSFLVAGLDRGPGLRRVFKVRLRIGSGKRPGAIPAGERPLSG